MRTVSLFILTKVKPSLVKYRACGTYKLKEKYRKCEALKKSIDYV